MTQRCDAITKKDGQCKRSSVWTIPNTLSGTGIGNDWVSGRPVHLCEQHATPFVYDNRPVRLVCDGWLQRFNKHMYGSIVLENIIDWMTVDYSKKQMVPAYWGVYPPKYLGYCDECDNLDSHDHKRCIDCSVLTHSNFKNKNIISYCKDCSKPKNECPVQ